MPKKKNPTPIRANKMPSSGNFSPRALLDIAKKEHELKLSSHDICKNPYKYLDYSIPFYHDILRALCNKYQSKFKVYKICEKTVTESSNYITSCVLFVYPIFIRNRNYIFIEPGDYNKATYGIEINHRRYFPILEEIKRIFTSGSANKRSSFLSDVESLEGVLKVKRFAHTTSKVWERRIMEFIGLTTL